ncbi:ATP-binding protein [Catenulispora rubra]|uniref:ATP-binding protein n=1 Tax=Catenulispora rubra TaxID=280293 RepID=UPI0018921DD8|nr:AAA family ATPase [Catenulispora rubra]
MSEIHNRPLPTLHGRTRETAAIGAVVANAIRGRGGALVVHGEAGIGKTSLVTEVVAGHPDVRKLSAAGAEFEMELAFAARRLEAERAAFLFCLRDPAAAPLFAGLPQLAIAGLGKRDAEALLNAELHGPLDPLVRDRVIAEARGNPLALIELPRSHGPTGFAGGFALPEARPMAWQLQESFAQRLDGLPDATRTLLLIAAAEPVGDPLLLWAAAERLGIAPDAAVPAEAAGLLEIGARVRFRHPLVRSAVHRKATLPDRRQVHRILGDVVDAEADPERRAWHQAQGTHGLDEDIAAELERCADRAQARGGMAAAAAFLERAAALTPDPARRAARALAAARTLQQTGAPDRALDLLDRAEAGRLDASHAAQARLLRGQLTLYTTHGEGALEMLLTAAQDLDPDRARETYLEAFMAARWAGRFGSGDPMADVARAYRDHAPAGTRGHPIDLLLEALTTLVVEGHVAAVPVIRTHGH